MSSVGTGVREIRVHTGGEYRVLYVAMSRDAIYVLHAFEKHMRRARRADVELARVRLRAVARKPRSS